MLGFFLGISLVFSIPLESKAAQITIRIAHDYPPTHIRHKSCVKWKELLEKESKGQVEVKIYPAGQLMKGSQAIDGAMTGTVDMIAVHGGMISPIVPLWDIFQMPFLWPNDGKNFEPAWKFKQSEIVKKIIIPKLEQKGIKFTGFVTALGGSAEFSTTNRAVRKVEDFKGLKMNTSAGWMRFEAVKALGASCISMPTTEIAMALSQGTIDGEFGTTTNTLASGLPVKYVHWWPSWSNDSGSSFLMNMGKWNSLPKNIKDMIDNLVTPETQKWTNKAIVDEEMTAVVELKKRGCQFIDPAPGTLEECQKRVVILFDIYEKRFGKEGSELISAARATAKNK